MKETATTRESRARQIRHMGLAVASGLLLTGSFPKFGWEMLAWFALVPLLAAVRSRSVRSSFLLGMLAGVVHYVTLLYWVEGVVNHYGYLPKAVAVLILGLLTGYLGLYIASFAAVVRWCSRKPIVLVAGCPVFWVVLEWLRGLLLTGFPWECLGHSQFTVLHLIQISDIFGVYGVSALIMVCNAALFLVILLLLRSTWNGVTVSSMGGGFAALVASLALCFTLAYGARRLETVDKTMAQAESARVTVVQGNIDQSLKWDPPFQETTIRRYLDLSLDAATNRPDLVVWPETALPFYFTREPVLSQVVIAAVRTMGTFFLVGSPTYILRGDEYGYFNSAYLIGPDGTVGQRYDKVHLVPYGEYVPLKRWLPFLGKMVQAVGDFMAGDKGRTLLWRDHRIGALICYEVIFPDLARSQVRNGAHLLVNMTNDAWFGTSSAPYQHFSMAVFRAVENKRALARAANTGVSGFVDPAGRILETSPLFQEATLTKTLPLMEGTTFYTRVGDLFALLCLLAGLVMVLWNLGARGLGDRRLDD